MFINRVHPPAEGATGELLAALAVELARAGWSVTVIAARPPGSTARREQRHGVRLEWVGGLPFTRARHWRRALSYLTLYPAMLWRALRLPRADVVVTLTDPPLQLVLGPVLKCFKRCRLVHWAQDIYPDLAERLGVIKSGGFTARGLRRLAVCALRRYDRIVAVGRCMNQRLLERGLQPSTIALIGNWADAAELHPVAPAANPFREEHGLVDRFVVMYSGNLGLAHPFEAMLDAAALLQKELPRALFLFVGEGPRLPSVRSEAEARKLGNVRFLPPQPREKLAFSLGAADLHLASMREELCGLVVPSKVYTALAAGRPCVFLGPPESEVAQIISSHGCGSVVPAASGRALADCLMHWAGQPEALAAAGARAGQFAREHGLAEAAGEFHRLFDRICTE